jgi:ArsR family transcriptional regulator
MEWNETSLNRALKALANERRIQILDWLKAPRTNFPPQVDGDLEKDGVCGVFIAEKLQVSQPTASEHMRIRVEAGLVQAKRIKQWTFYKRSEPAIRALRKALAQL